MGCFNDYCTNSTIRDIGSLIYDSNRMTVELCTTYCFLNNFTYAGLRNKYFLSSCILFILHFHIKMKNFK